VKMHPPAAVVGKQLGETGIRRKYGITVIGVKAHDQAFAYATNATVVNADDIVIVSGSSADIERFAGLYA